MVLLVAPCSLAAAALIQALLDPLEERVDELRLVLGAELAARRDVACSSSRSVINSMRVPSGRARSASYSYWSARRTFSFARRAGTIAATIPTIIATSANDQLAPRGRELDLELRQRPRHERGEEDAERQPERGPDQRGDHALLPHHPAHLAPCHARPLAACRARASARTP